MSTETQQVKAPTAAQIKQINKIKIKVDKDGNNNKRIDGDEISIFAEKLEEAGFKNVNSLVDEYFRDPLSFENEFFVNGKKSKDSVDNYILSQLNPNSYLVSNQKTDGDGKSISDAIEDACGIWGWTNLTDLGEAIDRINENNVLDVINKYTNDHEPLAEMLEGELSQSELDQLGKPIIKALVDAASKRFIDVTSLVSMDENGDFTVGAAVEGANAGESATDSDNFAKVVNALKAAIDNAANQVTDKEAAKADKQATMYLLARQADGNGDGNGFLNGNEIGWFKAACAKLGISINSMLISIKDKTENKTKLSSDEEYLQNIFDTQESFIQKNEAQNTLKTVSGNIVSAITSKDKDALNAAITGVHKDNVLDVLDALETDEKISAMKQNVEYDYRTDWYEIEKFDGFSIAKKMYVKCGSDAADEAVKIIINALYELAEENDIPVSDIVKKTETGFTDKNGKNIINKKDADEIIDKLRTEIKDYLEEDEDVSAESDDSEDSEDSED